MIITRVFQDTNPTSISSPSAHARFNTVDEESNQQHRFESLRTPTPPVRWPIANAAITLPSSIHRLNNNGSLLETIRPLTSNTPTPLFTNQLGLSDSNIINNNSPHSNRPQNHSGTTAASPQAIADTTSIQTDERPFPFLWGLQYGMLGLPAFRLNTNESLNHQPIGLGAWPFPNLHLPNESPSSEPPTPTLQKVPLIQAFLTNHGDTHLACLITRLTDFAQRRILLPNTEAFSARLLAVIKHYNEHPSSRESLNNVALVSTSNCHDGVIGGLIEMEKHLDNLRIIQQVEDETIDATALYEQAKKHFALKCIETRALDLCAAGGSTSEAIELELLLIKRLAGALEIPVKSVPMQNEFYGKFLLNLGYEKYYKNEALPPLLELRLTHLLEAIEDNIADKDQVVRFMSQWEPAQKFAGLQVAKNRINTTDNSPEAIALALTFEHLATMMALSSKNTLEGDDKTALKAVWHFINEHSASIPAKTTNAINQGENRPSTLSELKTILSDKYVEAIKAIHEDMARKLHHTALKAIYL